MAEKQPAEVVEEVMVVEVEDTKAAEAETRNWQEEFEMAGSEVMDFMRRIGKEVTARRLIIQNRDGRTLLDMPVAVGVVGFFPPVIPFTIVGAVAAVLTRCKVTVVHEGREEAPEAEPAEA